MIFRNERFGHTVHLVLRTTLRRTIDDLEDFRCVEAWAIPDGGDFLVIIGAEAVQLPMTALLDEFVAFRNFCIKDARDRQHLPYLDAGELFEGESIGMGMHAAAGEKIRSEEHTSELQSRENLVCRLLLEKKKKEEDKRNEKAEHQ